jgi:hypothetical protein
MPPQVLCRGDSLGSTEGRCRPGPSAGLRVRALPQPGGRPRIRVRLARRLHHGWGGGAGRPSPGRAFPSPRARGATGTGEGPGSSSRATGSPVLGSGSSGPHRNSLRWGPLSTGPLQRHRAGLRTSVATRATRAGSLGLPEQVVAASPSRSSPSSSTTIHRCQALFRWLREHPQVQLSFGPRSCPHHHPMEWIWGAMRTELANTLAETMAGWVRQVHAFFGERSDERRLRCALSFRSPWLSEGSAQNVTYGRRLADLTHDACCGPGCAGSGPAPAAHGRDRAGPEQSAPEQVSDRSRVPDAPALPSFLPGAR